jgi:hypothetical protein
MANPNYYGKHVTKQDYDRVYKKVCFWLQNTGPEGGSRETPTTITRIYDIKEPVLRQIVLRSKKRKRNSEGLFNQYSSNKKILNTTQEKVVF